MVPFSDDSAGREAPGGEDPLASIPRGGDGPELDRLRAELLAQFESERRELAREEAESPSPVEEGGAILGEGVDDPAARPVRSGPLRELLDAEFDRCHRFDPIRSLFGDIRTFLRRAVARENEEDLPVEEFRRSG